MDIQLRASWTPNIEANMDYYRLYRTDIPPTVIADIPAPASSWNFAVTVPTGSSGTLRFYLTAVNAAGLESSNSNVATVPFGVIGTPPAAPTGFGVQVR